MVCGEFDLIAGYFDRCKSHHSGVKLGIGDDCALLAVAQQQWLAVSTDTLVSGVHFLPDIPPADLSYKALAVNLSDLAAMGAEPAYLSLALTLPKIDGPWLKAFSDTLFEQLNRYEMQLIGGDTTCGPLSLTLTVHGLVPANKALTRAGACVGDWIYVTGTLGDSAAGLALLQEPLAIDNKDAESKSVLINRHLRPQPRLRQGKALRGLASAAIDISDGLVADLQHILQASNTGARIELDKLPCSDALKKHVDTRQARNWALSGREDYELCFTVPEVKRDELNGALEPLKVAYTCIGQITPQAEGVKFFQHGKQVSGEELALKGFDHFAERK